jgi:hypothetical protein
LIRAKTAPAVGGSSPSSSVAASRSFFSLARSSEVKRMPAPFAALRLKYCANRIRALRVAASNVRRPYWSQRRLGRCASGGSSTSLMAACLAPANVSLADTLSASGVALSALPLPHPAAILPRCPNCIATSGGSASWLVYSRPLARRTESPRRSGGSGESACAGRAETSDPPVALVRFVPAFRPATACAFDGPPVLLSARAHPVRCDPRTDPVLSFPANGMD